MSTSRGFVILDFGSQLTQLIARRLREMGYFAEIFPYTISSELVSQKKPYGIILSGGPSSVYDSGAPQRNLSELLKIAPVLGICYGMQLLAHQFGGQVKAAKHREYGHNQISWKKKISDQIPQKQKVWMSHGDIVEVPPEGVEILAVSDGNHTASFGGLISYSSVSKQKVLALQFHPEVVHTDRGEEVLRHFAQDICQASHDWNSKSIFEGIKEKVLSQVAANDHVLVGLSGGVDSSVVAFLLTKILGADRVHCVFVNNGLLRKNEFDQVLNQYKSLGLNMMSYDGSRLFLKELRSIDDPEKKRKIIGKLFIDCFEQAMEPLLKQKINIQWLAQGTLYPDVIESISFHGGPSQTIKSHHNVGGLPEKMKLKLLEPVRELFKDEVRGVGKELGLPHELIHRHPFPGPGLAIRILGEVTEDSLNILRECDAIFINKLKEKNLYHKIWQAFCVLLPIKTVGVQGDGRTYSQVLALRAVTSVDGMTADWFPFDFEFLREVSNEITNKVPGVNRVVYDVTSKPPATIEWE